MGKHIVYEGASAKDDKSAVFYVNEVDEDGQPGKMHRLSQLPTEVPDALAAELLEGSERTKGHKFSEAGKEKRESASETPQESGQAGAGGSGQSTDPSGTTRSQAR